MPFLIYLLPPKNALTHTHTCVNTIVHNILLYTRIKREHNMKMATTIENTMNFRPNTIEENVRILRELKTKHKGDTKSLYELNELLAKLNRKNVSQARKKNGEDSKRNHENVVTYQYGRIGEYNSGSWWGIRMDCSRDRVHDPFDEDIQVGPNGVVSLCTSHSNTNNDVDFGDYLTLTGEIYHDKNSKDPLMSNCINGTPLRLIRSYNLLNKFAPKTGYRYDGLYIVVMRWVGVFDTTKRFKYALRRLTNQEPAPWNTRDCNISLEYRNLRKISNSKRKCTDAPGLKMNGNQNIFESGIITRQVFKKSPCEDSIASTNALASNLESNINGSKTHSTNISIRTDLYDSSHTHQNVKKSILMRFHKVSRVPEIHLDHCDLSSKNQKVEEDKQKPEGQVFEHCVYKSSKENQNSRVPCNQTKNTNDEKTEKKFENFSASKIAELIDSTNKSLDETTPDKILNFIDKEKYHPLSKILIGNMIGLSPKDSITLQVYNNNNSKTEEIKEISSSKTIEIKQRNKKLKNYEFQRGKKSLRIKNHDKLKPQSKKIHITRNSVYKMYELRRNVMKEKSKVKKEYIERKAASNNSINKKETVKLKSICRKKPTKGREVLNLFINTNMNYKTRGPRNRRLRCMKKFEPQRLVTKKIIKSAKSNKSRRIDVRCDKATGNPPTIDLNANHEKIIQNPTKTDIQHRLCTNKNVKKSTTKQDATTQCSLISESPTNSFRSSERYYNIRNKQNTLVKIEFIDLDEFETLENVVSLDKNCRNCKNCKNNPPYSSYKEKSTNNRLSAFVPVETSLDNNLRIARLRSIGFKPINPTEYVDEEYDSEFSTSSQSNGKESKNYMSKVVKRDADIEYNKYTSEENNVVRYMDDELEYQDIESEDEHLSKVKRHCKRVSIDDDNLPWHGWKRVQTDQLSYWVGW